MTRAEILDEAKKCVCGKREQDYGSPEDNFKVIADLWSAYYGAKFTSLDVAMMMSLLKIARVKSGGGTGDSFVDLAGYAACGGEIKTTKKTNDDICKDAMEFIKKGKRVSKLKEIVENEKKAGSDPKKRKDIFEELDEFAKMVFGDVVNFDNEKGEE